MARQDVGLDITDVYLFGGEVGTVFVMSVNSSASGRDMPVGSHPAAHYDFRLDADSDIVEDSIYRALFGPLDQSG